MSQTTIKNAVINRLRHMTMYRILVPKPGNSKAALKRILAPCPCGKV